MPISELNQGTIQYWLTWLFARLVYSSGVEKGNVSSWSGEHEVYVVDNPESPAFGQATPVGTLLLNKGRIAKASSHSRRFVVEHERGHQTRRPLFKGVFFGTVLWMALSMMIFTGIIGTALLIPFGFPVQTLVVPTMLCVLMMVPGLIAIKLEEITADLHVLKYISIEDYYRAHDELSRYRDTSKSNRLHRLILYTSPSRIVKIHQLLQRIGLQTPP